MTDARENVAPAHPADIIAQDIRRFSRTEGAGRVGEIALSSLHTAGFRILGPDEVDPVTLEMAAEVGKEAAKAGDCHHVAAVIRALWRKA